MWWECSECGGYVECARHPVHCGECGRAGVIFMPVAIDEPLAGDPDDDCLRAAWLRSGIERAQAALSP